MIFPPNKKCVAKATHEKRIYFVLGKNCYIFTIKLYLGKIKTKNAFLPTAFPKKKPFIQL
jgi:hypothetical protein